ncbi:MAG: class I SAM-dependent methyltransferase [Sphingomonadales bacterium]|nr:class I SAM-dependent methyltransferase [Sphingomonadales bacterium]
MIRLRDLTVLALSATALLMTAPSAAKPGDYAAAIADKARVDKNRALDEGRMPADMLDFAGVKRGDVVADYQAGGGYYTELLSRVVGPKGRVYALTQPNFYEKDYWDKLVASHPNVMPLVAPGQALTLAPGSVDVIFTHLVYHDLYWTSDKYQHPRMDVPQVLKGWFAAVKPGGHVIVIDHAANPGEVRATVDKYHRIDPEQVKADMAAAGFVLEGESDMLRRTNDPHDKNVFDPAVRGKTDRFALKFRHP